MKKNKSGFTLIELVIVIGIALILFGFVTLSLTTGQRNISVSAALDTLISDLSAQQTKSMQGEGGGESPYGIYFEESRYILFKGETYSPMDPENFEVKLGKEIIFSDIAFPGGTIVFSKKSGEVLAYSQANNIVTISDSQGEEQETIEVNRYGVVVEVD